jgi:hypothetical protein
MELQTVENRVDNADKDHVLSKFSDHLRKNRVNRKVVIEWKNITFKTLVKDSQKSKLLMPVYKKKTILNGLSGTQKKSFVAI